MPSHAPLVTKVATLFEAWAASITVWLKLISLEEWKEIKQLLEPVPAACIVRVSARQPIAESKTTPKQEKVELDTPRGSRTVVTDSTQVSSDAKLVVWLRPGALSEHPRYTKFFSNTRRLEVKSKPLNNVVKGLSSEGLIIPLRFGDLDLTGKTFGQDVSFDTNTRLEKAEPLSISLKNLLKKLQSHPDRHVIIAVIENLLRTDPDELPEIISSPTAIIRSLGHVLDSGLDEAEKYWTAISSNWEQQFNAAAKDAIFFCAALAHIAKQPENFDMARALNVDIAQAKDAVAEMAAKFHQWVVNRAREEKLECPFCGAQA